MNSMRDRLYTIRYLLNATQNAVALASNIPRTTYTKLEEVPNLNAKIKVLTAVVRGLNKLWQMKYGKNSLYPTILGDTMVLITLSWLVYGRDDVAEYYKALMERQRKYYEERQELLLDISSQYHTNKESEDE